MRFCPVCTTKMIISKLTCKSCNVSIEGDFKFSAIARLSSEDAKLAEQFILSGGNLKTLSEKLDVSYPTLRKRLDKMIDTLSELKAEDEVEIDKILSRMEKGEISANEGVRKIKEIKGEA